METKETGFKVENGKRTETFYQEPKQETLEEAAKENFKGEYVCNGIDIVPAWREGFIVGAKWQQERMYSEEEVKEILTKCTSKLTESKLRWFELFKKK